MAYLGSWGLESTLTFYLDTALPETGAVQDADTVPIYRIYDAVTNTPVWQATMALMEPTPAVGVEKTVRWPAKTGRFVKLIALAEANNGPYTSCAELNIYAGTLLPRTGFSIVSVDSEEPPYFAAALLLDGNPDTFWHTEWINTQPPHPHTLILDLGTSYAVDGLVYLPRPDGSANGTITQYEVYVSANGVSWGTAVSSGILGAGITGLYAAQVVLAAAAGFRAGGRYGLRLQATVSGITGAIHNTFRIAGLSATLPPPARVAFRAPQPIPRLAGGALVTTSARWGLQAAVPRLVRGVQVQPAQMAFTGSPRHFLIDPEGRRGRLVRRPRRISGRFPTRPGLENALVRSHPLVQGLTSWWLVRRWMFPGWTWFDLQGENHATLTAMGHHATSGWGGTMRLGGHGELRFDGVDDAVTCGTGTFGALDLGPNFTLSAWVFLTSFGGGSLGRILDKRGPGSGGFTFLVDNLGGVAQLGLRVNDATAYGVDSAGSAVGTLTTDRWTHVAVTVEAASTVTFYVDGQPVAHDVGSGTLTQAVLANDERLLIGAAPQRVDRNFDGKMDDIRIWRRVLANHEMATVYVNSLLGYPNLLAPPHPLWIMVTPAAATIITSRVGMRAATALLQRTFLTSPTRHAWRATTPLLVRRLVVTAGRHAWRAPPARTGRGFVEPMPARMGMRATGTRTGQFVQVVPAKIGF
jgi:hypothetical protein